MSSPEQGNPNLTRLEKSSLKFTFSYGARERNLRQRIAEEKSTPASVVEEAAELATARRRMEFQKFLLIKNKRPAPGT